MKAYPVVIVALVVVVVALRLRLHRGRARPTTFPSARRGRWRVPNPLGDTGLVAGREIRERVRGRVFRVVTIVLFAVVSAAVVIPTLHAGSPKVHQVGVVGGSSSLDAEVRAVAVSVGLTVTLVTEPDWSAARAAVAAGRIDLVVDGRGKMLVRDPVSDTDTSAAARLVRDLSAVLGAQRAFAKAGLTPAQAAAVANAKPLPVESLHAVRKERTTSEATALIGVILIFIVLSQYLTWTLMGVMEEKASRVVEVLLSTLRPLQLLAGKVIGIGVVALLQAVSLVAFALLLAKAVGSSLAQGAAPFVVAATLLWLILGYAFYSWLYAAAGSLAERQDQIQSLALPLGAPLIFGYIVSLTGVSTGHASLLVRVLAYIPFTAPLTMPTLVGFGDAAWWQFLASALISAGCTVLVALAAAYVYRAAVLRTGARVHLRELAPRIARFGRG